MTYTGSNTQQNPPVTPQTRNGCHDARLAAFVVACLRPLEGVSARPLGACYVIFHAAAGSDTPVGVVWGGGVYFKAGPDAVTRYIARGMRPLRPGSRQPLAGYWRVPDDVVAEPGELCDWARSALDAALRFGKRRRAARRRKRRCPPPLDHDRGA